MSGTPRPWQVWRRMTHTGWPPRIVATYATKAKAEAERDRCNTIIEEHYGVRQFYVRKRV